MVNAFPYTLLVEFHLESVQKQNAIWAALEPEFMAIDSKRVKFLSKSDKNKIVFHLTTRDVTALRAAATTLMRLYVVADGVHQFTVNENG